MRSLLKRRPRGTAEFNDEGLRRVHVRGDIGNALAPEDGRERDVRDGPKASALDRVAPETPRPAEMLESVVVQGDDILTAGDMALHELLVAWAYEKSQRVMPEAREYKMPTSYAVRFLGEHARRATVRESLKRLRSTTVCYGTKGGRYYRDVPLLSAWIEGEGRKDEIVYTIPSAIETLMASQLRYAYLELAALSKMRSRYGVRLYRHLALAVADMKAKWTPGTDNLHVVSVSVADMKAWLGWDGDHIGQLQLRALKPAVADLEHVRLFSHVKYESDGPGVGVEPIKGKRRGGGIDGWKIVLRLNEPPAHHGRMFQVEGAVRSYIGGWDVPRFRVARQDFWQRKAQFLIGHGHASLEGAFHTWLLAVHEALTQVPVTDGYATRGFRGERLLAKIDADGPEDAAACLLAEEVDAPDLIAMPADILERRERLRRVREARSARIARWKAYKTAKGIVAKGDTAKARKAEERKAAQASRRSLLGPRQKAAVPAPAPVVEPTGQLAWVEFLIDKVVPLREIEAMQDGIFAMTLTGREDAPVSGTIRFHTGLGTDTLALGDVPLSERDVSFIAKRYETIIEDVRCGRKGA